MDTGLVYREIKPASFWGTWSCAVAVYLSVTFESSTQKGNSTTSSTVTPAATSLAGRPAVRVDSVRCLEREQRERERERADRPGAADENGEAKAAGAVVLRDTDDCGTPATRATCPGVLCVGGVI
jgi:hypothetical protein